MKSCRDCGKKMPLTMFYRHASMADGHLNKCKRCVKARVTKHRIENVERIRAYDRKRASQTKRVEARRAYAATSRGRAAQARGTKAWRLRNAEKRSAHMKAGNAIRNGKITRQPCEVCGAVDSVEAHHDDYSKPLDVRWLCKAHHAQHHKDEREKLRQKQAA